MHRSTQRVSRARTLALAIAIAASTILGTGCVALHEAEVARRSRYAQIDLARVAKDWSQTIRASQVIPVYPLTEDLQPGDVFLVTETVDEQHRVYEEAGYLALANHLARLDPRGYEPFYARSFAAKDLPKSWLKPGEPQSFELAPAAAFPTYSFTVKSGQAFSGALPIQGVPVGLSLLGASSATGSVTIDDARTYGVDVVSLHADLRAWAAEESSFLAEYAREEDGKERYLRVVTRVFLAGRLKVTLDASSSTSAGLAVGAPKPAEIPTLAVGRKEDGAFTPANYDAALASLNTSLAADMAPGASLKVTAASGNSITLAEKFPRPIAIGYLGFDVRILPGGALGPPMPTHAVLESGQQPTSTAPAVGAEMSRVAQTYRVLAARAQTQPDGAEAEMVGRLDELADRLLPVRRPVAVRDGTLKIPTGLEEDTPIAREPSAYRALISYLDALRRTSANLRASFANASADADDRRAELARVQAEITSIEGRLRGTYGRMLLEAERLASRD